ncbi:hypothetical protein EON80_00655 [bacterium]|nr:MAG: hypothetical protein EON80_00655 [bacterium]
MENLSRRSELDEWHPDGQKITSMENLEVIRKVLEDEGPVILERRIYRGSSSPERAIFESFDEIITFLETKVLPGDSIWIWSYDKVCRSENALTHSKIPDEDGCVPLKGAY